MALRTYLPLLKFLLQRVCNYIGTHRLKILEVIGEDNATALDGVIVACEVLVVILDEFIPAPV